MTLTQAITAMVADMRRRQLSTNTIERYARELHRFAAYLGSDVQVRDITPALCRGFIDTFDHHAASTVALEHTILSSCFDMLVLDDELDVNPMTKVRRPKVPALRDRKRTRISTDDVRKLLQECRTWRERLCLNLLAYTGCRRNAAANVRWSDVDAKRWTITFAEKGGKRISKPVPAALADLFKRYALHRSLACDPIDGNEWLVPSANGNRTEPRSNRVVYIIVKNVAARAGVTTHVHALRAAFAVHFLETNPKNLEPLRQLLGHSSIATTQAYLSEMEGQKAMQVVEGLTFADNESDLAVSA